MPGENQPEKNKNDVRIFLEQVRGHDPVPKNSQWNKLSVDYIGFV